MQRYLRSLTLMASAALLIVFIQSYSLSATTISVREGQSQTLGNGAVRTYVEVDDTGDPTEVGVILSDYALTNLPAEAEEYVLQLPPEAASTAITHIGLNWRSHGHAPDEIYHLPHFDVHAYVISPEEREAITATADDLETVYKTPESELIPTGYVMAPDSAEPRQGSHWIDPTAAEFQGSPHGFDHTMIYGFYNGEMTFVEPMVTIDYLQSQQEFEGAIALPARYSKPSSYPTGYSVTYNEATGEHTIALTGFTSSPSVNQTASH